MIVNEYAQMYALEKDFWWYRGLHDLVESFVQRHAQLNEHCHMLDAGCGTGRMMQVASRYGTVQGIDYAQEAVYFCERNGLQNVCRQDLNEWQPQGDIYDIIISLDVLYHAAIRDDADVVGKFYHALKADGVCIVNLPAFPVLFRNHDLAVFTKKRYRKKEAIRIFTNAGFKILLATYRLPHLFILILAKKIIQAVVPGKNRSDLQKLPTWLNDCLYRLLRAENRLIMSGIRMPFGSSLFLVAGKQRRSDHDCIRSQGRLDR